MNSLFLLLLGGSFTSFFMTVALAIPPLPMKNWPCVLIRACVLNRKNTVCNYNMNMAKMCLSNIVISTMSERAGLNECRQNNTRFLPADNTGLKIVADAAGGYSSQYKMMQKPKK